MNAFDVVKFGFDTFFQTTTFIFTLLILIKNSPSREDRPNRR
ncbi:hypothetical protein [Heyndrickxia acidicola]|uniref:Photosystem II protein I n=1 Tax=Heyndrickxia acidicola TaxID=209389 RepID=A0ABU6MMZ5_9BACI|nr:hypothetical protein [Heyndrickxia acidicola]MED1205880.1 hypothetical protein [Heyndrickxia acidicola]